MHFVEEKGAVADTILEHLREGDLVLTLGAGDIWKTGEELLGKIRDTSYLGRDLDCRDQI